MAAPKRQAANQPLAATWPLVFEQHAEKGASTRWIILKVDGSMDWRQELDGARLNLAKEVKLTAPNSAAGLHARVHQDAWRQHLLLKPQEAGSHRLSVSSSAQVIVQVSTPTAEFLEAEEAASKADRDFAEAARRRAEFEAPSREYYAKRREDTQLRCSMTPLDDCLAAMGWPHGTPDESGDEAAAEVTSNALPEEALETHPEPLHVKVLPTDEAQIPLGFWSLCPASAEEMTQVHFDRFQVGTKRSLVGRFTPTEESGESGAIKLTGTRARRAKTASAPRYLVGAQQAGSKKLFVQEAELYRIDVNCKPPKRTRVEGDEEALAELEDDDKPSWGEQRGTAVNTYGTAKKQRIRNLAIAKRGTEHKVVDFEKYTQTINKRALELEAAAVPLSEKIDAERRKVLPAFDEKAEKVSQVYKKGLEQIAPLEAMQGEAAFVGDLNKTIREILMKQPEEVATSKVMKTLPEEFRGCLITSVILAFARQRSGKGEGPLPEAKAEKLAMKLICLHHMQHMYKHAGRWAGGKSTLASLSTMIKLDKGSALVKHWHKVYFEEMLGRPKHRAFNGKKLLFAIIVWALHLTPSLSFEMPGELAEEDLMLQISVLAQRFEYVGCDVTVSKSPLRLEVKLKGAPKIKLEHYEAQARKESEKSSKRKR